jgi:hypothetical protein
MPTFNSRDLETEKKIFGLRANNIPCYQAETNLKGSKILIYVKNAKRKTSGIEVGNIRHHQINEERFLPGSGSFVLTPVIGLAAINRDFFLISIDLGWISSHPGV